MRRSRSTSSSGIWCCTYASTDEAKALTGVRKRALEETLAYFRQHGADLPAGQEEAASRRSSPSSRRRRRSIRRTCSTPPTRGSWSIDDPARLKGLPQGCDRRRAGRRGGQGARNRRRRRAIASRSRRPRLIPVMEHLDDESIRRQAWEGSCTVGRGGEHDNTALVWQILRLRHEKAQLLGKRNFADLILERRMAKNGATALGFTEEPARQGQDGVRPRDRRAAGIPRGQVP